MTNETVPVEDFFLADGTDCDVVFVDNGVRYHVTAVRLEEHRWAKVIKSPAVALVPPYMFLGQEAEAL